MSIATRNARLMVAYRAVVLSPLYWPYMLHFTSGVRGLSALEFGLLKGLYYLVCTTAEVPCGAIADRVGRRPSLALSAAFGAVAMHKEIPYPFRVSDERSDPARPPVFLSIGR